MYKEWSPEPILKNGSLNYSLILVRDFKKKTI